MQPLADDIRVVISFLFQNIASELAGLHSRIADNIQAEEAVISKHYRRYCSVPTFRAPFNWYFPFLLLQ